MSDVLKAVVADGIAEELVIHQSRHIFEDDLQDVAASVLTRLGDAGWVVVMLPVPQLWDGPFRERYWRVGDTTVSVDKNGTPSITLDDRWDDESPPTPGQLRELAAALLAAANEIEEIEEVADHD